MWVTARKWGRPSYDRIRLSHCADLPDFLNRRQEQSDEYGDDRNYHQPLRSLAGEFAGVDVCLTVAHAHGVSPLKLEVSLVAIPGEIHDADDLIAVFVREYA